MIKLQAQYAVDQFNLDMSLRLDSPMLHLGIIGANGSGKSTLLKTLCGLRGHANIQVNEKPLTRLAMVFQRGALFEHLTVEQNLRFAAKHSCSAVDLDILADRFAINSLLHTKPSQLSGGQRQRVALARAFAQSPEALFLDEAFSAMDWQTKLIMMQQTKQLIEEHQLHCLMVSHDPDELQFLCDQAIHLDNGTLQASGSCKAICSQYFERESARQFILEAQLQDRASNSQIVTASIEGQPVFARQALVQEQRVFLRLSSNQISISLAGLDGTSMVNQLRVSLDKLIELNTEMLRLELGIGEQKIWCDISRWSAERLKLHTGQSLYANFKLV